MPRNTGQKAQTAEVRNYNWRSANTLVPAAIMALVAVILLAGAFALGHHAERWDMRPAPLNHKMSAMLPPPSFGGQHRFGSLLNSDSRAAGVVTAVNGDKFTVASNGATKDVTTNSSTQYEGGDSVKVNDTVLVTGATSGGQFTADRILINP